MLQSITQMLQRLVWDIFERFLYIFDRSAAHLFLKALVEIGNRGETDLVGNFGDGLILATGEQPTGQSDSLGSYKTCCGGAENTLQFAVQLRTAHIHQ